MNEVYNRIKEICLNTNDNDPVGIARKIMHDDLIKMHGPCSAPVKLDRYK